MIHAFVTLIGLIFGSYFTTLIYRVPLNNETVFKRSFCPNCLSSLHIRHLIPLFSSLYQKGKCHKCQAHISLAYPLCEIFTALLFVYSWNHHALSLAGLKILLYGCLMILLGFIDFKHLILPHRFTFTLLILGLSFSVLEGNLAYHLKGGFYGILPLLVLHRIGYAVYKKEILGIGDIILAGGIGLFWGVKIIILTIHLSFISGGIIGSLLLLFKKKSKTDVIPFGPVIITSSLVAIHYSSYLWTIFFGYL